MNGPQLSRRAAVRDNQPVAPRGDAMSAARDDEKKMIVQGTFAELRALIRDEVQRLAGDKPAANDAPPVYVSIDDIQRHFGVSRGTVNNWVHKEGCPHDKRGRILRFKLGEVEAWFSERKLRRMR